MPAKNEKKADKPLECPVCHGTKIKFGGHKNSHILCAECGSEIAGPRPKPATAKPRARISAPGTRHRRNNGPAEFLVTSVPPPTPAEIGPGHHFTSLILAGGERGVIAAESEATRLGQKFGEDIEAEWCLATPWLKSLVSSTRPGAPGKDALQMAKDRERARYALMWRPRFLAIVSLCRSVILGCRGARVACATVSAHRRDDPEFDAQVLAAQDRAVELLHDVTFRDAVEGWMEPVYWQGIRVGSIRKVDNRLRVEMLRAHMPRTFKTPGQQTSINIGAGAGSVFNQSNVVIDAGARDELVALRQEALQEIARARKAVSVPLGPEYAEQTKAELREGEEKAVSALSETTLP